MRFSLRNVLWSMFWFAAWGTLYLNRRSSHYAPDIKVSRYLVFIAIWYGLFSLPLVASYALVGKTKQGFVIGLWLSTALLILYLCAAIIYMLFSVDG
jgi:hypothetical protein